MKTATVTSAIKLSATELTQLKSALKLSSTDKIVEKVNPSLIAGLLVEVDGIAIDLTVKHQLSEISRG